jgi:hypothetical protein
MTDYKKILDEKIHGFLFGGVSFKTFEKNYYDFYVEDVPEDGLTDNEFEFYGEIQEKIDWVDEDPGLDRQYGYITPNEYKVWLEEYINNNDKLE